VFLLWIPFVALQLAFGLGLGVITSVLHVFVRDTAQFVTVAFQLAFWATPIVYVETILPESLQRALYWNPLAAFSRTHRDIMLYATPPSLLRTLALVGLTTGTLALGTALYRHFRADILDEL
jgi:lipopolysaccharide transport system permease protein